MLPLKLQKALALLAYLVVNGQPYTREALATLLWPDYDQSGGRGRLRRTLYELNNILAGDILTATSDIIRLDDEADVWIDVQAFRQIVADSLPGGAPDATLSQKQLQRLEEAAELYSDDFLAGFSLPDAPEFEEWRFFLAEELRRSLAAVLVQLSRAYRQQRAWDQAIQHARRWLALDALHEPAHRLLMRLYASSDRLAAALRQYEQCVQLLRDELGAEPEKETTELYEA
ncbi:MAG: AfsR/SARP family transcriptional regulator, partial [Chloroflexota bacterium]